MEDLCPNQPSNMEATFSTRIRWTRDLHDRFVECVNRLGGAERATAKGILELLDIEELTIYHVKSHLLKYRTARSVWESKKALEGTSNIHTRNEATTVDQVAGTQIAEALQLQMDLERCLHEQQEIQNNLQSQIEEKGRQLQKMLESQLKSTNNFGKNDNYYSDGRL